MKISNLFERDIFRPINGVVKADQLDEASVWQELDEFVVTRELDRHLNKFFTVYTDALKNPNDPKFSGKIGVWVYGFFGSGKSHFIKVLSYILRNRVHNFEGKNKRAVDFFEGKIKDALLYADIKRAVASNTDVILFNIDSKADHREGRDAILAVFLKVLNELQGYCGDHPHIAHLERYLEGKGKLNQFKDAFKSLTNSEWANERDAYHFHRDEMAQVLSETLKMSIDSATKWVDGAEGSFALTVENFGKWTKEYLDSKSSDHRLIFLVDEIGQFIGADSHLMLNLQTITEELGTLCKGRAWIVVTSQEDMDAVLGDMKQSKKNDFSKIQGRFETKLSLSSANVDEVIQSRLLEKGEGVNDELKSLFSEKGDILKSQLTFINCGMTFRNYKDDEDFARNYPFAPYQFQLLQKIFEAIRRAGATGLHLSRGERSILDAFQSAAKQAAMEDVGILVPLYFFYPSIEGFLDTVVKRTIDQAADNASLEEFDIKLLKVLFLIRYVDEIKGNVDNLVTLCIDEIDADRLNLRRRIEASLGRLEKETLINRNGDLYFFLTNEERDINREIKAVEISSGDEAKILGELIFSDVLKEQRKYRYPVNKMDFTFNRLCDLHPVGNAADGALLVSVVSPLNDEYDLYTNPKCLLESGLEGGHVLIHLGNDLNLGRELRTFLQTEKYVKRKNDGTLPESAKRVLRDFSETNNERRNRLVTLLNEMLCSADYYAAGQILKLKATTAMSALNEALEYLVLNTFSKMGYLKALCQDPLPEIQAILRSNDISQQTLALQMVDGNKKAVDEVRSYVATMASVSRQNILQELIEKRFTLRPFGWPESEILILIARLLVLGEISLMMDTTLISIEKAYEALTSAPKRRKISILKRPTPDPKALQAARELGKELFHETGPEGEDPLFVFLQEKFKGWQTSLNGYKPLAETGEYPGKDDITDTLLLIRKLLAFALSHEFIEHFNTQKDDLIIVAGHVTDLQQFYDYQKPVWEKLRRENDRFKPNRIELERTAESSVALKRISEILTSPKPYGMLKEADGLINTVSAINTSLVATRRKDALHKLESHVAKLNKAIEAVKGDGELRAACLKPLGSLKNRVQTEGSLAHITQAEIEALSEYDAAFALIEEFARRAASIPPTHDTPPTNVRVLIKKRVIEPFKLVNATFLENKEDVEAFLGALRKELEQAIANDERIEIR